jgi:uncharacterized protein (DUF427 family)
MTLTLGHGPLSGDPPESNYAIDGPQHRLLFQDFPRRIRARLGGETVLDTRRAKLLHETGLRPQLYVPEADVCSDLLAATDHTTHCPFKGDARYWTVHADGKAAENAVWSYPEPLDSAPWLRGHVALYWDRMDAWLDEDEEIVGRVRDPYHRVDVRDTSRHVRVLLGDEVLADTERARLLSETGLANRYYIPPEDVRRDRLEPSETSSVCPYKGVASYWSAGDAADVAWAYGQPFEETSRIADHLSFGGDGVVVEADGERVG